jgi:peptidoglycan hydrolase-like protein with peptidoglycan-binding domain
MARFEQLYPPVIAFGSRTLTGDEQGTDVAVLQIIYDQMLGVMNQPGGPIGPEIPVTGMYDAATQDAVRRVQAYFGLVVDGVVETETYRVFGQGVGSHATYGGPPFGSRTLEYGSVGGDVGVLQNRLNCFRYAGVFAQPAEGFFGPKTRTIVQDFQQDAELIGDVGLVADGVANAETFNALWIYTYAGGRTLIMGSFGFDVVFIQKVLADLRFYTASYIDGLFGPVTQKAVSDFQLAAGVGPDGRVGPETFHIIGSNNFYRPPHPLPVPPLGPVPPPSPQVNCCFTLEPTACALGPTRGASAFIHNGPRTGPDSVGVQFIVSAVLPDPSIYGPEFTGYGLRFSVGDGTFDPMETCPSVRPDLWVFSYVSASTGPFNHVHVQIAPLCAAGSAGPVVLEGQGDCPFEE